MPAQRHAYDRSSFRWNLFRNTLLPAMVTYLLAAGSTWAGPILELWKGTIGESTLPGYNVGANFQFTVLYDDSDTTYTLLDLGPDGVIGTGDDQSSERTILCAGVFGCYNPIANGEVSFGSIFEDGAEFAARNGHPLREVAPNGVNSSARTTLNPDYFGYTGNSFSYNVTGFQFSAFYEPTGILPNGIENAARAGFFTEESRFFPTFEVQIDDLTLMEIPLGTAVKTGLLVSSVPVPGSLALTVIGLLALRWRSPKSTSREKNRSNEGSPAFA